MGSDVLDWRLTGNARGNAEMHDLNSDPVVPKLASHTPLSAVLVGLSRRINTILSFA